MWRKSEFTPKLKGLVVREITFNRQHFGVVLDRPGYKPPIRGGRKIKGKVVYVRAKPKAVFYLHRKTGQVFLEMMADPKKPPRPPAVPPRKRERHLKPPVDVEGFRKHARYRMHVAVKGGW